MKIPASSAASSRQETVSIPVPNRMSISTRRKGGAILFFATCTQRAGGAGVNTQQLNKRYIYYLSCKNLLKKDEGGAREGRRVRGRQQQRSSTSANDSNRNDNNNVDDDGTKKNRRQRDSSKPSRAEQIMHLYECLVRQCRALTLTLTVMPALSRRASFRRTSSRTLE